MMLPWPRPKDAMRATLSLGVLGAFMIALSWVITNTIPQGNEQLVTYMLGQLSAFASMPLIFYFGTSKSSSDKNDLIAGHGGDKPLQLSERMITD